MEQRGKPPGKLCPFCGKDGARVFEHKGIPFFKCFHTSCPSGTCDEGKAFDAIGFLAFELGLSRREAFVTYLKEAGVWTEARLSPNLIAPHKRRTPLPEGDPDQPPETDGPKVDAPADARHPAGDDQNPAGDDPGDPDAGADACNPLPAAAGDAPPEETEAAVSTAPLPPAAAVSLDAPGFLALRAFYEKLTLSPADAAAFWTKRGLTPETCARLGYRSNPKSNRDLLLALANAFPPAVLVESGLWVRGSKPGDSLMPNVQYHGWGIAGKIPKEAREPGGPEWRWDWTGPVLIPYFQSGQLVHLRPHKGMMKEKPVWFYAVPRAGSEPATGAILTEGEFKAAALAQVLGDTVAVGSLPGITMSKQLLPDIEDWLSAQGVRQVVVAFDNEEKGDPNLPGFKPEKWRRYDTQVWARYLVKRLADAGYEAGLAQLPDAWRDPATGKGDWDGALRRLLDASPPA